MWPFSSQEKHVKAGQELFNNTILHVWRGNGRCPGSQTWKNCFLMPPRGGGGWLGALTLKNSILMHPMEGIRRLAGFPDLGEPFPDAPMEGM